MNGRDNIYINTILKGCSLPCIEWARISSLVPEYCKLDALGQILQLPFQSMASICHQTRLDSQRLIVLFHFFEVICIYRIEAFDPG